MATRKNSNLTLRRASTASFRGPRGKVTDEEENKGNVKTRQSKEFSEQGKVKWDVYKEYAKNSNLVAVAIYIFTLLAAKTAEIGKSLLQPRLDYRSGMGEPGHRICSVYEGRSHRWALPYANASVHRGISMAQAVVRGQRCCWSEPERHVLHHGLFRVRHRVRRARCLADPHSVDILLDRGEWRDTRLLFWRRAGHPGSFARGCSGECGPST